MNNQVVDKLKPGVDYVGVGIGVVIVDNQGRIFLSKRGNKSQNERGKWECPGGRLEFSEGFIESITREIKEEFGVEIKVLDWLAPFNHLIPEEHQHWVALCALGKIISGKPQILEPEKSVQIGWFTLEEMEKLDLTLPASEHLSQIRVKYPDGLILD